MNTEVRHALALNCIDTVFPVSSEFAEMPLSILPSTKVAFFVAGLKVEHTPLPTCILAYRALVCDEGPGVALG